MPDFVSRLIDDAKEVPPATIILMGVVLVVIALLYLQLLRLDRHQGK